MFPVLWRVRPLAVPALPAPCRRCAHPFVESTQRFRVNSNGRRHDVWLIYRCPRCGARQNYSLHRRVRERALTVSIDAYRRDDPELARACAFAAAPGRALPYQVDRAELPHSGVLCVAIAQPHPCGVRCDVLLARELACARSRVRAAIAAGAIDSDPRRRASDPVRDGDRLRIDLDWIRATRGRGR